MAKPEVWTLALAYININIRAVSWFCDLQASNGGVRLSWSQCVQSHDGKVLDIAAVNPAWHFVCSGIRNNGVVTTMDALIHANDI